MPGALAPPSPLRAARAAPRARPPEAYQRYCGPGRRRGISRRQADASGARVIAAAADELPDQRHVRGGRLRPARDAHP